MQNQETKKNESTISRDLLDRFQNGEITAECLNAELAYWILLEMFDKIHYVEYPTRPVELVEFDNLLNSEKDEARLDCFKLKPVQEFMSKKSKVDMKNRESMSTLKDMWDWLPETDEPNRKKVQERMSEFENGKLNESAVN